MPAQLVIYHKDCADGFGAAFAAWKRLGDAAEYLPAAYGDQPPQVDGRDVVLLDFTFPRAVLLDMKQRAASLLVLDHHKTAAEDLAGLDFARLDLNHSGAVLAWRHWHDAPVPDLLRYVEDKDLWHWKLPQSAEVSAALQSHPLDFATWDRLQIADLQRDGVAILRYQRRLVREICAQAGRATLAGHDVPCVNSPILQSYLGNELAKGEKFAVIWYEQGDGRRRYSLRSAPPHGVDVSAIARRFGGGGHPAASGFSGKPPEGPRRDLDRDLGA